MLKPNSTQQASSQFELASTMRRPDDAPPRWQDCFPKPVAHRSFQYRLIDVFILMTAASVLFALARSGSLLLPILALGASSVVVAVGSCNIHNPLIGQVIGAAVGVAWCLLLAVTQLAWAEVGLLFMLFPPFCAWLGSAAAVLRKTELD